MHKYLVVLAAQKGFRIKEIECEQFDRPRETSYYGFKVYLSRLVEILNLFSAPSFQESL
jgi:hypothetical protein